MSPKKLIYRASHSLQCSRHVTQVILQAPLPEFIAYAAGQYLKVSHGDDSDSPLSIACSPRPDHSIELHISHPPINPRAHEILQAVKQKKVLTLRGPYGTITPARFTPTKEIIFFVRGTGFAPVKALLENFIAQGSQQACHLFWAAAQEDFYLQDLLREWEQRLNFRFTLAASRSAEQHKLQHEVVSEYPDLTGYQVYASGPEVMITDGLQAFVRHGLTAENFYSDIFDYDPCD
jgi:CDP-4-dehydro-6-deoxyglucose reductase